MSNMKFEHLFSPLQVGPMRVPNRICETTNTMVASESMGFIDEPFIAHHVAKARGGTGWIGSETWLLNTPFPPEAPDEFSRIGRFSGHMAPHQVPGFVDGVGKFCDEVHKAGAVAVFQLTHLGAAWAPSAVPIVEAHDYTPHVLDEEAIEFFLNTYAEAAAVAKAGGADGLEIHCAHETLPHSFLSPATNLRTDRWGGGPQQRIRFVIEVLERVRKRVGSSLALGIRMNGQEFRQGGYDNLEMREMAYHIGETGLLDFLSVDVGHCWGAHSYVPSSYYDHAQYREVGKAARADLDKKIAVLFTGRINDPVLAEELLKGGYCDLVGMTRAGIADPEFANKAREGRLGEIRRCIACTRCIDEGVQPKSIDMLYKPTCSINPVIGRELRWQAEFRPAEKPKRVVVVGGGVSGLEAARVAALRGHKVTVLEQGKRLGGLLLLAAKAPGRDSFEDQIYFEENEMTRLGVDVRLETCVDIGAIKALSPDAVVIATGSVPRIPHGVPGIDLPHVVQGWDVLRGKAKTGKRVALISQEDYYQTPSVAEFLAAQGKQVEIFHKSTHVGSEIGRYSLGSMLSRLELCDVSIHPNLILTQILPDGLDFASSFWAKNYHYAGFDSVVLLYGSVPLTDLYDQLKAEKCFAQLYLAGSAWLPRRMAESVQHGASIGLVI